MTIKTEAGKKLLSALEKAGEQIRVTFDMNVFDMPSFADGVAAIEAEAVEAERRERMKALDGNVPPAGFIASTTKAGKVMDYELAHSCFNSRDALNFLLWMRKQLRLIESEAGAAAVEAYRSKLKRLVELWQLKTWQIDEITDVSQETRDALKETLRQCVKGIEAQITEMEARP